MIRRLLLLLAVVACSTASPPEPRSAPGPAPLAGVEWTPFRWVAVTMGDTVLERAAIYVPFTADTLGGSYWLQLDTGADVGIWLYTASLKQLLARRGGTLDTTRFFPVSGSVGDYAVTDFPTNQQSYRGDTLMPGDTMPKIGTLGLEFFRERVLLLDFPGARFAILESDGLPSQLEAAVSWVPVTVRSSKLFLPVVVNGTDYENFFYDSGASLFPIVTTDSIWQQATGRVPGDSGNVTIRAGSFGREVALEGAPLTGSLSIGSVSAESPLAFHLLEGPESLRMENWDLKADGLIGNALFADDYLVIVDLPRSRFGIMQRD